MRASVCIVRERICVCVSVYWYTSARVGLSHWRTMRWVRTSDLSVAGGEQPSDVQGVVTHHTLLFQLAVQVSETLQIVLVAGQQWKSSSGRWRRLRSVVVRLCHQRPPLLLSWCARVHRLRNAALQADVSVVVVAEVAVVAGGGGGRGRGVVGGARSGRVSCCIGVAWASESLCVGIDDASLGVGVYVLTCW